jgi:transposase
MMHYLGFDCQKSVHAWTLLDPSGQILQRGEVANRPADLAALRAQLPTELRVGLEGPRHLRQAVETAFAACPLYEISPGWTVALRDGSPRPDKTDPLDADRVAALLVRYRDQLSALTVQDQHLDALRATMSLDRSTVRELIAVQHRLHTNLTRLWQDSYRSLFRDPLGATGRRFFTAYPHPHLARHARGLAGRLRTWSGGRFGLPLAQRLHQLAAGAPPPSLADQIWIAEIRDNLARLEALRAKRQVLQARMRQHLEARGALWLLQQPGLGVLRAAQLVAAGFFQSRNANAFARHAGIAPEEDSSGRRHRQRNARRRHEPLFQTCMGWAASLQAPRCHDPQAVEYYQRKLREHKTRRTALRCLARRLIDRLFRLRATYAAACPPPVAALQ